MAAFFFYSSAAGSAGVDASLLLLSAGSDCVGVSSTEDVGSELLSSLSVGTEVVVSSLSVGVEVSVSVGTPDSVVSSELEGSDEVSSSSSLLVLTPLEFGLELVLLFEG